MAHAAGARYMLVASCRLSAVRHAVFAARPILYPRRSFAYGVRRTGVSVTVRVPRRHRDQLPSTFAGATYNHAGASGGMMRPADVARLGCRGLAADAAS